ncbi:MAG: hypothetical protein IJH37_05840 [Clostridia bacterium]|nr:hypothetical protein [Clostridia bacterium]
MKKYLAPDMEIRRFAEENVVTTGSAAAVDSWNEDNGYNATNVDWDNLKVANVTLVF